MKDNSAVANRKEYLDYLRVFAAFCVMLIHVSSQNLGAFYFNKDIWRVFNIYDSMSRWAPPVFVMISGALFLGREIDLKKLYSKYVLRILAAFLVWNLIYYLLAGNNPIEQIRALFGDEGIFHLADVIRCHYHMWYLLMILGVYICIPILKLIADNKKVGKYFIILSVIFTCIIPVLFNLVSDFGSENLKTIVNAIKWNYDQGLFSFPLGYMFYFVLGYYIANMEIEKISRIIIYILGIVGFAATALLEKIATFKYDDVVTTYYDSLSIQAFLMALAIFVFFKHLPTKQSLFYKFVMHLSKISFGAYLVHALVIEQMALKLGINTLTLIAPASVKSVILTTPVMTIIVFIISMLISEILSHIPVVKKIV